MKTLIRSVTIYDSVHREPFFGDILIEDGKIAGFGKMEDVIPGRSRRTSNLLRLTFLMEMVCAPMRDLSTRIPTSVWPGMASVMRVPIITSTMTS